MLLNESSTEVSPSFQNISILASSAEVPLASIELCGVSLPTRTFPGMDLLLCEASMRATPSLQPKLAQPVLDVGFGRPYPKSDLTDAFSDQHSLFQHGFIHE